MSVQAEVAQPSGAKIVPAFAQVTGTDEIVRHLAANGNVTVPVVVVWSVYEAPAVAVNAPVIWRLPVAGTVAHPRPASDTSNSPDTCRHDDDVTFQVPSTLPPQGDTLVQFCVLEGCVLPPVPLLPVPPPLEPPLEVELPQPFVANAASATVPKNPIRPFRIENSRLLFAP